MGNSIRLFSFGMTLKKKYNISYLFTGSRFFSFFGFKRDFQNFRLYLVKEKSIYLYLRFIFFRIFFPNIGYLLSDDYANCYFNNVMRKSLEIIKKNNIKYVIISAPPFSFFKIAKKLNGKFGGEIEIILDYRDGWTTRYDESNFVINLLKKNSKEKKLINYADKIICSTDTIFNSLKRITNKKKIYLIKNGYININNIQKPKSLTNRKKIKIGYFGLISDKFGGYRDINILYKALKNNGYLKDKLVFEFYGDSNIKNQEILNFKPFKFYKGLDYFEARKKMNNMDYLLIIHTEKKTGKEVITGKFYDYVASKAPILSVTEGQIEANKLIKKYKLGITINYQNNNLTESLKKIVKKKYKRKPININNFSRSYQNKTLFKILN